MTNRKPHRPKGSFQRDSGMVLIAALTCLLIVTGIIGAMLQTSLRARRQLRVQRDVIQCELLLQAGVERAVFKLSGAANYQGETWEVPAEAMGSGGGQVRIEASREQADDPWNVRVVAEYPAAGKQSIRRSKTITVPL